LNIGQDSDRRQAGRRRLSAFIGWLIYQIITAYKDQETENRYLEAQDRASRRTANATVAMAFLTFAIFVVGIFQYVTFNGQLGVVRGQLEEMQRAYGPTKSAADAALSPG
jgi:hypothetical protein